MGKWAKVRWGLRSIAAILGVVGVIIPPGSIATLCVAIATAAGTLTVDMPRDPWSEQKRQKQNGK